MIRTTETDMQRTKSTQLQSAGSFFHCTIATKFTKRKKILVQNNIAIKTVVINSKN